VVTAVTFICYFKKWWRRAWNAAKGWRTINQEGDQISSNTGTAGCKARACFVDSVVVDSDICKLLLKLMIKVVSMMNHTKTSTEDYQAFN